jgi:hypothetical protein
MNDDLRIPKIIPPFYPGHNNHQNYRILGFLPYVIMGYETIKFNVFMLVRYKYPGSGLKRIVPFREIPNTIKFPFIFSLPFYLVFDVIKRNRKYNKNKSFKDKAIFTTDLILFHSLATVFFPLLYTRLFSNFFPKAFGFFIRSKFPLMFLSTTAFVGTGAALVKCGDVATDYLLDNTFRKFVYNLNIFESNKNKELIDGVTQPLEVGNIVENIVKI